MFYSTKILTPNLRQTTALANNCESLLYLCVKRSAHNSGRSVLYRQGHGYSCMGAYAENRQNSSNADSIRAYCAHKSHTLLLSRRSDWKYPFKFSTYNSMTSFCLTAYLVVALCLLGSTRTILPSLMSTPITLQLK